MPRPPLLLFFLSACLTSRCQGFPVQRSAVGTASVQIGDYRQDASDEATAAIEGGQTSEAFDSTQTGVLQLLSNLLLMIRPKQAAWLDFDGLHHGRHHHRARRIGKRCSPESSRMSHVGRETQEQTDEELAAECIEEKGCTVGAIDVLLENLQAAETAENGEISRIIEDLQSLRQEELFSGGYEDDLTKLRILKAAAESQKGWQERALGCFGPNHCSVDTIDALLEELKAEKDPNPKLGDIVEKLCELRKKEEMMETFLDFMGMESKQENMTPEEQAAECRQSGGCTVEEIDALLYRLALIEDHTAERPLLSKTISELKRLRRTQAAEDPTVRMMQLFEDVLALLKQDASELWTELSLGMREGQVTLASIDSWLEKLRSQQSELPELKALIEELELLRKGPQIKVVNA